MNSILLILVVGTITGLGTIIVGMVGDTADNIIGIKGIGPKTAAKLLEECDSESDYWSVCVTTFMTHEDLPLKDAEARVEENMRLLRLQRVSEETIWSRPDGSESTTD